MTAPDDKGPSPEEEFHHELDELFDNNNEDFVNWMQSKGWRDATIKPIMPSDEEMNEWHEQMTEDARIHLIEMEAALVRAQHNFNRAKLNYSRAQQRKGTF